MTDAPRPPHDVVEETEALGARLGAALRPGDFVGLVGELGAGKTAFVRGVATGLGIPREANVSSPTYAIVNLYKGGRVTLLHADLYRLRDAEDLYDLGWDDLLASGVASVVEWFDRVPDAAPGERLELRLLREGEDAQHYDVTARGGVGERLRAALTAAAETDPRAG